LIEIDLPENVCNPKPYFVKSLSHFIRKKLLLFTLFVSNLLGCYKNRFGNLYFAVTIVMSFGSGLRRNLNYEVASTLYKSMVRASHRTSKC
jgi:hypothetical protein